MTKYRSRPSRALCRNCMLELDVNGSVTRRILQLQQWQCSGHNTCDDRRHVRHAMVQFTYHLWRYSSKNACDYTIHVTLVMIQFTQHLWRYMSHKTCDGTVHETLVMVQFTQHLWWCNSRNTSNDTVHTTLVMVQCTCPVMLIACSVLATYRYATQQSLQC
jgi:hypothetical protein